MEPSHERLLCSPLVKSTDRLVMVQIYRKINDGSISNKSLQQLHNVCAGKQDWFKLFNCGSNIDFIVVRGKPLWHNLFERLLRGVYEISNYGVIS